MTTYLLDANVLIALTVREHEQHERCTTWLAGLGAAGAFATCPIVEGALVRFLLRAGESKATAQAVVQAVAAHDGQVFWPDAVSYASVDLRTVQGHRQVTDSYLVGLASSRSGILATLDEALARRHAEHCLLIPASDCG